MENNLDILLQQAVLHKTVNKLVGIMSQEEMKNQLIRAFMEDNFFTVAKKYDLAEEIVIRIRENIATQNYRRAMHLLVILYNYLDIRVGLRRDTQDSLDRDT